MQFLKSNNSSSHKCFFSGLTREQIVSLELEEIDTTYLRGDLIFREGTYPKSLFVVYRGAVKVHKYGDNGKEQITRLAQPGDLLGYRALLGNQPYKANATALQETKVFKIPGKSFINLLKTNADFSFKVMELLSDDLKHAEDKLLNMAQKSVREKIAETLVLLYEKFGLDESSAINSKLTRKEIGDIAGTTTESTIRTISDFNKENIVQINGKKLIVNDINLLKNELHNKIA